MSLWSVTDWSFRRTADARSPAIPSIHRYSVWTSLYMNSYCQIYLLTLTIFCSLQENAVECGSANTLNFPLVAILFSVLSFLISRWPLTPASTVRRIYTQSESHASAKHENSAHRDKNHLRDVWITKHRCYLLLSETVLESVECFILTYCMDKWVDLPAVTAKRSPCSCVASRSFHTQR